MLKQTISNLNNLSSAKTKQAITNPYDPFVVIERFVQQFFPDQSRYSSRVPNLPNRIRRRGGGEPSGLMGRSGSQRDHLSLGEPHPAERDGLKQRYHHWGFVSVWFTSLVVRKHRGFSVFTTSFSRPRRQHG